MRYAEGSTEKYVEGLKDEIDRLRRVIVDLAPQAFQELLQTYYHCKSRQDTHSWEAKVVDRIITGTPLVNPEHGPYQDDRAKCPLCGSLSDSPYGEGFKIPEGLRRHLIGWGGPVRQCDVMRAAMSLANDYWNRSFAEGERREAQEREAALDKRRSAEFLYLVDFSRDPLLSDEGLSGYPAVPRTEDSLAFAEARLAHLGFSKIIESKVIKYLLERDDLSILADPRANGAIYFTIYRKPPAKRQRYKRSSGHLMLPDSWKRNLSQKFEERLKRLLREESGQNISVDR